MMQFEPGIEAARRLDADDSLSNYRSRFLIPAVDGEPGIYFVGNSLGLSPRRAPVVVGEELDKWAQLGVGGHFASERPWVRYHEAIGASMARLVGADPSEVVMMNTLTVNLHFLMISFYRPTPTRHKILIEDHAFPSDHFAAESQIRQRGFDPDSSLVTISPRPGEDTLRPGDIIAAIRDHGEELALVMLPGIQYYTGQVLPMADIAAAAREVGAQVGLDLAHAAGNVELELHDWNVDFAAWCTYKYLNGGPGAIAGAFVHSRHLGGNIPRLHGWWGHKLRSRFEMATKFDPEPTADAWAVSNAPILAMAPLVASMEIFDEVGMGPLRRKSMLLTAYLEYLLGLHLDGRVESITPIDPRRRGCQLSLRITGGNQPGHAIYERLRAGGVVCDWRYPAVIRVAPVPLYNTFEDVHRFVEILAAAMGD